ncbi:hypothetical protein QBZ16_002017 [Prototheca wickerhamii]|uniref:MOSC domain-containing protein n=1 Tax=Prototheca wickerhamii TaxID=3111 RepID=A0AAD9MJB5_PROWI|nr:hypothetical protein QBZ16_002017 [Prototheca wickerhamii]
MESLEISEIHVYPVKSCGGMSLDQAVMTPKGFRFDREWVVTSDAGKFMTQRQHPEMATIAAEVTPRALVEDPSAEVGADTALLLRAPGMAELRVPLADPAGARTRVRVWDWEGSGLDEGEEAAAWLTELLGKPARLVRFVGRAGGPGSVEEDPARRATPSEWTPEGLATTTPEVAFADAFPKGPLSLNRFRGNIVVAGAEAWAEDGWARLAAPSRGVDLALVKPCARCAVPTVNQETGDAGYEPTRTLQKIRSGKVLGWHERVPPFKGAVFFGWNALASGAEGGVLARGDALTVLERRDQVPVPREAAQAAAPADQPAQARQEPPAMSTTRKMFLLLLFFAVRALFSYFSGKKKETSTA